MYCLAVHCMLCPANCCMKSIIAACHTTNHGWSHNNNYIMENPTVYTDVAGSTMTLNARVGCEDHSDHHTENHLPPSCMSH